MTNDKILNFLAEQIAHITFRAKGYIFDEHNRPRPKRDAFKKIQSYINSFLKGKSEIRWLTLTGLRGAGKTTLLFQIFDKIKDSNCYKLFLSTDQATQLLNISLNEALSAYEDLINMPFEKLDRPLFLFLDEIQYDENWAITLKSIYDRSRKVFIFATGSSALELNQNTDIARRTIYEKLLPLDFTEYLRIKKNKTEQRTIGKTLKRAIFHSKNAKEAYDLLIQEEKNINIFLLDIDKYEIEKYINYGSLPFMISLENESLVYNQINKMLGRIINNDIAKTDNLSSDIITKIPRLLYAVSSMDVINFSKMAKIFELSRPKVTEIFDLLEQTEVLIKVFAYGSNFTQAKKPSKYLFSAPSFRAMYYKSAGGIISTEEARGKILEDLVGMYLTRLMSDYHNKSLSYDSAEGGADFIAGFENKKLVIEVGAGSKGYNQAWQTGEKIKSDYNIIISRNELDYSEKYNAVKIPLRMFLLL